MPDWLEKVLITMAMASGLIAMLIKNYGGAWVLFTMVLIYLILLSAEAIKKERMERKMLKEFNKMTKYHQEGWKELLEVSKAVAEKFIPPTEEKRSVEDEK